MLYRENGQFKTSYSADQQILQDRIAMGLLLGVAFVAVPLLASEYMFRAILIPFVILALAALGLNILVGFCGQISLGTGAFMAVGAYAAYNFQVRIDGMPVLLSMLLGGLCATAVGVVFGIPSLRIKGLYLAVATLAAQFFVDWAFLRIKWFTNDSASGSVSVSNLSVFGLPVETPVAKYLFCLAFLVLFGLLAKNLVRGHIGREWMAIRDMDVAAAVIGIRPVYAKLSAFAVSSFIVGVAGVLDRPFIPVAVHGHHRRPGLDHGQFLWRGLHRAAANPARSIAAGDGRDGGTDFRHRDRRACRIDDLRFADRLLPDRRTTWPGPLVGHRQREAAAVAIPALTLHFPLSHRRVHLLYYFRRTT
jgi:ABC-type branched-subunit amino acid transport system permease subunit